MSNINVITQRDDGANPGSDIINPLITTESVAISAGTQFIDANHKNRTILQTNGPLRDWIDPASLAEVIDSQAESYKAMVTGVNIKITKTNNAFTADANLTLEKVNE